MPVPQPVHGTLHPFDSAEDLAQGALRAFVDLACATIDANGLFHVALSGGSTPRQLYRTLATEDLPWESIHWYWGDERNVPQGHAESNYRMVREALLDPAEIPAENVHAVPIDVDYPAEAALRYEGILRNQFPDRPQPEFDLVLLGMGDDAHTASLFPETAALRPSPRWFVENWVPKFDAYRLTLTAGAINAAANVWFLIAGENKRRALTHVWGPAVDTDRYPSQLIHPSDGVLWWMVSAEALPELPPRPPIS